MDAEEKQHIESLLKRHQRRLRLLEQRAAASGINTPAELVIEMQDIQGAIAELQACLNGEGQDSHPPLKKQPQSLESTKKRIKSTQVWFILIFTVLIGVLTAAGIVISTTISERKALTASANSTATALSIQANLAFGPRSDWITSPITNTFVTFTPDLRLHDLVMEASIKNTHNIRSDDTLSYGFPFRIFRDYPNKGDWEAHSIILFPQNQTWILQKGVFTKGTLNNDRYHEEVISNGKSQYIKSSPSDLNKIKVIVKGSVLLLYINSEFIERINIKDISEKGDVGISARIQGKYATETKVEYDGFTIWSLDP